MRRVSSLATLTLLSLHLSLHAQARRFSLPDVPKPHVDLVADSAAVPGDTAAQNAPAAPQSPSASTPSTETLTLKQAEEMALKNNPRISEAALLALAQKEIVRETRSTELPSIFGNLTAEKAEEGTRLSSGSLSASRLLDHAGGGLTFSQLITDFGHTRNLVASSSLQAKAADQTTLATRDEIFLAVDVAFYGALEAQATLQVAQSTVAARSSVNEQVGALTASKLKSTLDQSFAQVNLSQAQLLALDAQNQAQGALAALNEVLGSSGERNYTLVDSAASPDSLVGSAEELVSRALQQRPDLHAQQLAHDADVRFARAQRDQLLPTVSTLGMVGGTPWAPNTPQTNYFVENWYGAVGVNVSVPIFNGFKFHAQAQEADYRARASDERSRQLADLIARDVRTAWLQATTARQRMTVTKQLVAEANTALELAQTRYNLGLSSIVELSQAQLQQTQAQIADANARFEYESDLATLRFQTGTQP
jgi:outer membrane protein